MSAQQFSTDFPSPSMSPQLVPAPPSLSPGSCRSSPSPHPLEVPWFALPASHSPQPELTLYPDSPLNLSTDPLKGKRGRTERSRARLVVREPRLPADPRLWCRAEVCAWVQWTCLSHSLPLPATERFLMNGKAVCLMSTSMFSSRVPLGGKLLYKDFQIRLAKAINTSKVV